MMNNIIDSKNGHSDMRNDVSARIQSYTKNKELIKAANEFNLISIKSKYSYNFEWLGRPIIQYPQDIVAMQELIWSIKPDLIIETGIAHGGSLIFSASMLALLDYSESDQTNGLSTFTNSKRMVLGIDIDIRDENLVAIQNHPLSSKIEMIQGSSTEPSTIAKVKEYASDYKTILVSLDSNHTHDHVLAELEAYSSLVSVGSYCVIFDTVIDDLPAGLYADRPWDVGNNPKTAVSKFLETHDEFEIDSSIHNKLLVTVAPNGYLKRIK